MYLSYLPEREKERERESLSHEYLNIIERNQASLELAQERLFQFVRSQQGNFQTHFNIWLFTENKSFHMSMDEFFTLFGAKM